MSFENVIDRLLPWNRVDSAIKKLVEATPGPLCIACSGGPDSTLNEYRQSIEKDMALNRRFQPILVEQPSPEDTLKILEGLRPRYEAFHNVHYSEAILKEYSEW